MGNIELLASFVNFLNKNSLLDLSVLKDNTDGGFNNRLKCQKYVYLAQKRFDLDLNYDFSRYKFGPYSSNLTENYYDINIFQSKDENIDFYDSVVATKDETNFVLPLPKTFKKSQFLKVVSNRDEPWLEVATTIIHVAESYDDCKIVLDMVSRIKPSYEFSYIKRVFEDLQSYDLLGCQ